MKDSASSSQTLGAHPSALLPYLLGGIVFGFVLVKSEAASWYRIQEMFRFQGFHMFGVIGSAVLTAFLGNLIVRQTRDRALDGTPIQIKAKEPTWVRYILGGVAFGVGWGLIGVCPGPVFALLGTGVLPMLVVLVFALFGTWVYAVLNERLPH
ncbi:MAG: DUF6691 family protein [Deinococcales bacterium]